jgi:hypothetical protein
LLQRLQEPPPGVDQTRHDVSDIGEHAVRERGHEAVTQRSDLRYAQLAEDDVEMADERRLQQLGHLLPAESEPVHLLLRVAQRGSIASEVGRAEQALFLVAEMPLLERNGTFPHCRQLLGRPDHMRDVAGEGLAQEPLLHSLVPFAVPRVKHALEIVEGKEDVPPSRLRVGQVPQARIVLIEPETVAHDLVAQDEMWIAIGAFDLDESTERLE